MDTTKTCMTVRTLYLGKNGTMVYSGHAALLVSTVFPPNWLNAIEGFGVLGYRVISFRGIGF